jgi:hypothetical protein
MVFDSFWSAFAALSGIVEEIGGDVPSNVVPGDVDVCLPGCEAWIRGIPA